MNKLDEVCMYLKRLKPDISPLKLQKSLYFIYAYYKAFYGKELFAAEFEAWSYGSVVREVYENNKLRKYDNRVFTPKKIDEEEIKFIDDLFAQIDSVSDFSLSDRNRQDKSWIEAYESESKIIDNNSLIKEYKQEYL